MCLWMTSRNFGRGLPKLFSNDSLTLYTNVHKHELAVESTGPSLGLPLVPWPESQPSYPPQPVFTFARASRQLTLLYLLTPVFVFPLSWSSPFHLRAPSKQHVPVPLRA